MDIIFFFLTSERLRLYLVTKLFFSDTWTWNFSMFQSLVLCVYEMLVALILCQCHFQELMLDKSRFFFFEIPRVKKFCKVAVRANLEIHDHSSGSVYVVGELIGRKVEDGRAKKLDFESYC